MKMWPPHWPPETAAARNAPAWWPDMRLGEGLPDDSDV